MNTPPSTVSDTEMSAKRTNASIGNGMPDSKRPRTSHKAPGEGTAAAAYLLCHSFALYPLSLSLPLLLTLASSYARHLHDRMHSTQHNND